MKNFFLCVNPEWQGCESRRLEEGSKKLAKELFKNNVYKDIEAPDNNNLEKRYGVFALDAIGGQFDKTLKLLQENSPQRVMTVGGSCGIDAAPVSYLNSLYKGDLAVVWFDAHGDLNTPESSPSGHFHGMVLRTLLGEGPGRYCKSIERPLHVRQVFLAGVRDLDISERYYIEGANIPVCEVNSSLANLVNESGFRNVYIHIDVDVINPDDFMDSLMPTKGGPTCEQLGTCISEINEQLNIVGLSIVEYCGEHEGSTKKVAQMLHLSGMTNQ